MAASEKRRGERRLGLTYPGALRVDYRAELSHHLVDVQDVGFYVPNVLFPLFQQSVVELQHLGLQEGARSKWAVCKF